MSGCHIYQTVRPRLETRTSNGHVQGMFSTLQKVASVLEIKEHVYIYNIVTANAPVYTCMM